MREVFNWISGHPVRGAGTFDKLSPVNGSVLARVHEADRDIVNRAVADASEAFEQHRSASSAERTRWLLQIADAIEANADLLSEVEAQEVGRPIAEVKAGHVGRTADIFRMYANLLETRDERARLNTAMPPGQQLEGGTIAFTLRRPRGVVALVAPWNVPLLLLALNAAPALAMGNAVVAKPSEETPGSAVILAELMQEAGLPAGLFNIVNGGGAGAAGEFLVSHPDISAIGFTGEGGTGSRIMAASAKSLADCLFELGGKNPGLIFADCDLDAAIAAASRAAFSNCGQICLSVERLYVERPVFDDVVNGLARSARDQVLGEPEDAATTLGPLISTATRDRVKQTIDAALAEGATRVEGGDIPRFGDARDEGAYLNPAVLTGLDHSSSFLREEVFGPVVHVMPFDSDDEAIALANDTEFGLASMTWTRDLARAHRCVRDIRTGVNWVNCWQARDLSTPLQGYGKSGVGVQGGLESLDFFSSVTTATIRV
ncbi:MAG: aldehyde dehydrogenase family protein [Pacificimonas sp.]|jgi:aminomuconate-semialdehyde/2-hydroxymuconate-6-semialdehyde dehydrogenase|nr:aldehyde dehydrogenase family protein [Pacificimonas sp.]